MHKSLLENRKKKNIQAQAMLDGLNGLNKSK